MRAQGPKFHEACSWKRKHAVWSVPCWRASGAYNFWSSSVLSFGGAPDRTWGSVRPTEAALEAMPEATLEPAPEATPEAMPEATPEARGTAAAAALLTDNSPPSTRIHITTNWRSAMLGEYGYHLGLMLMQEIKIIDLQRMGIRRARDSSPRAG